MNKTQFFKYLENGGRVRMLTWHDEPVPTDHKLAGVRYAEKVQSNSIKFNNGSWLYKDEVKASNVHNVSAGGKKPAICIGWAVYQLVD